MMTQVRYDRQKRRAKRRSEKARAEKRWLRTMGDLMRRAVNEKPRTLWHPENW